MSVNIYFRSWFKGQFVDRDEQGNRYYRRKNFDGPWQNEPRWVLYKGLAEGSKVPPLWHSWLHHTTQFPPSAREKRRSWEKPHRPNLTDTPHAFDPVKSPSIQRSYLPYATWTPPAHDAEDEV